MTSNLNGKKKMFLGSQHRVQAEVASFLSIVSLASYPDLTCISLGTRLFVGVAKKMDSSMLKSKTQVTLFVNYSCKIFYDFFVLPKIHLANRRLPVCAKIWDFCFYMGVIYGHTFNQGCSQNKVNARAQHGHTMFLRTFVKMQKQLRGLGVCTSSKFWNC